MHTKTKTLKLDTWEEITPIRGTAAGDQLIRRWRVVSITNSMDFDPGQHLTETTVEELVEDEEWKVTIVAREVS